MAYKIDDLLFQSPIHYDILDDVDRLLDEFYEVNEQELPFDEYLLNLEHAYKKVKSKLEILPEKIVVVENKPGQFFAVFYCISNLFLNSQEDKEETFAFYEKELLNLFSSKVEVVCEELDDTESD